MTGRPPRFSAGSMRHRINVQTHTDTQDSAGQPVSAWSNWLTNEPAAYAYTGGGQTLRGRQVEEGIDAVFTVRYRTGYSVENRVVFDSANYGIVHVRPVDGRQRYLELHVKAVAT